MGATLYLPVYRLLTAVGSLVSEHWLYSTGPVVVVHGFSCSKTCGISPDQVPNPCFLHGQADSLPLSHQESPRTDYLKKKKRKVNEFERKSIGTSLVVQWLRICSPVQGMRLPSLVGPLSLEATIIEHMCSGVPAPQLERSPRVSMCASTKTRCSQK